MGRFHGHRSDITLNLRTTRPHDQAVFGDFGLPAGLAEMPVRNPLFRPSPTVKDDLAR